MRTPNHWYPPASEATLARLTALALSPLGALYDLAGKIRFATVKPYEPPIPVICIGNLTAGGTGKTPLAMTLAHNLATLGHRPHILTRGYLGRLKGPVRVDATQHRAIDVGDEALLLASVAPVWIARDRRAGARAAVAAGADVIVMDDGHQNPALKKTLAVVVVDGEAGLGNARVIPSGPLRETVGRGLRRADAIVVMGKPSQRTTRQLASWRGPVFHAHLAPQPNAVHGSYLAFAGIGRPDKFFATLEENGAHLVERIPFPDHHAYTEAEVADLLARASTAGVPAITSAKDAARLTPAQRDRIEVLHVTASFPAQEAFGSFIMERLESSRQSLRNEPAR